MATEAFWENPCGDSSLGIGKGTLRWKKLMMEPEVRDSGLPVNVQRKRDREDGHGWGRVGRRDRPVGMRQEEREKEESGKAGVGSKEMNLEKQR